MVDEKEIESVRARCARALSHEPPSRSLPRNQLARLAEAATPELQHDNYGLGLVVTDFERELAAILGKEAAVFMPSGTMAQQIALRVWADRARLPVVAFHPTCHLEIHEERGYQRLHGLAARLVGAPTALITRADLDRLAEPVAALLLELPQREIGGQLPTWEELTSAAAWARERGVKLHLDGARLWETRPFYGRGYDEIAGLFDSVYVSLYKGLGGIAGCVLAGPADFIAEARVWQRRHGGTLVSVYPFILSVRAGLAERLGRMSAYHEKALEVARRLARIPGVEILPDPPHTNMMHIILPGGEERLQRAAVDVAAESGVWLFGKTGATGVPSRRRIEVTLHEAALEIETEEIGRLIEAVLERAAHAQPR